jgi:hypothetical protein
MEHIKRPISFWVITGFLLISVILLLLGQTMAVFDYELAVSLGLQEDIKEISEFGVQINRGFGAGDTVIYIPLIIISIAGLFRKRKWALITSAAVMGISSYWAVTAVFMFVFLEGVPGYSFVPTLDYWIFMTLFIAFGLWGLWYIVFRGEKLVR